MQVVGFTVFLLIIFCVAVATALSALFIWIGTKLASIPNATFAKAFVAALSSSIAVWALTGIARTYFGIGLIGGWLLGLGATLLILKSLYAVNWGKSLKIWIFTWIAHILVAVVILILIITGIWVVLFRDLPAQQIVPGITI